MSEPPREVYRNFMCMLETKSWTVLKPPDSFIMGRMVSKQAWRLQNGLDSFETGTMLVKIIADSFEADPDSFATFHV